VVYISHATASGSFAVVSCDAFLDHVVSDLVPYCTSWVLLVIMALYDLAAVLLPGGPVKVKGAAESSIKYLVAFGTAQQVEHGVLCAGSL
jgi:hypothetical protein